MSSIDIILSDVIRECDHNENSLISHSQLSSEAGVTMVLIDIILSAVIRSCGYNGSH